MTSFVLDILLGSRLLSNYIYYKYNIHVVIILSMQHQHMFGCLRLEYQGLK